MPRKRKVERAVRGLGSVYPWRRKRKDGTFQTVYVAAATYRDQSGKTHRVRVYGVSQDEATAKLKALQNRPEVRGGIAPAKGTVGEFIRTWLDTVVEPNLRAFTVATYRATVATHIEPSELAKKPLGKVAPRDVDVLYATLVKASIGSRTRLKVHDILASAFSYAMMRKQIASDPMFGIKRPRYDAPAVKALTPEQIEALLDAAQGDPLEALYVVTMFTGMRSGEVLSLTWANVDLEGRVITIRSSLQDSGKAQRIIGPPKTEKSARPIDLPLIAVEALKRHRQRRPDAKPSDLVFPNELGRPLWRQNLLRRSF